MFATTMSLKMHMNLSHPVKMEATETEQLLSEGQDKEAGEDDTDKVMEEMNNIGTSEMLDDLVNFLNELWYMIYELLTSIAKFAVNFEWTIVMT